MKLTTHLNLVLRLRICGPVTSLSHIFSWYCAQIRTVTVLPIKCHCKQYRPDSEVCTAMYLKITVLWNATCNLHFVTGEEDNWLLWNTDTHPLTYTVLVRENIPTWIVHNPADTDFLSCLKFDCLEDKSYIMHTALDPSSKELGPVHQLAKGSAHQTFLHMTNHTSQGHYALEWPT
jgi:hypothetical protein